MANVFLFIPNPIVGPGGTAGAGGNDKKEVTSAASPFALSEGEWANIVHLVGNVAGLRGHADSLLSPDPCASSALQAVWRRVSEQTHIFSSDLLPALVSCAHLVRDYAASIVPVEYGALKAILQAAGLQLTPADASNCETILRRLRDRAQGCADRAKALAPRLAPFADAVTALRSTFEALPRNPPVKVTLPSIPNVCLTYDGNAQAVAGDIGSSDTTHFWIVDYVAPGLMFRLLTAADPSRMLVIDRAPWMADRFADSILNEAPRPHVVAGNQVGTRMSVFVLDNKCLHPAGYGSHVLDCSGNDGWQAGTPILAFRRNDGSNQHWTFTPSPRPWREVAFHDCMVAPMQFAGSADAINHLLGDWSAIVDDLTAGIEALLKSVNLKLPFIGAFQVQQAMDSWAEVAAEAGASLARFG